MCVPIRHRVSPVGAKSLGRKVAYASVCRALAGRSEWLMTESHREYRQPGPISRPRTRNYARSESLELERESARGRRTITETFEFEIDGTARRRRAGTRRLMGDGRWSLVLPGTGVGEVLADARIEPIPIKLSSAEDVELCRPSAKY